MTRTESHLPSNKHVEDFKTLNLHLKALHLEMRELSKKKPDDKLNRLKVTVVNRVLSKIIDLLSREESLEFLSKLDDETLPSNSDAVVTLALFNAAMISFHDRYHYVGANDDFTSRWHTIENP